MFPSDILAPGRRGTAMPFRLGTIISWMRSGGRSHCSTRRRDERARCLCLVLRDQGTMDRLLNLTQLKVPIAFGSQPHIVQDFGMGFGRAAPTRLQQTMEGRLVVLGERRTSKGPGKAAGGPRPDRPDPGSRRSIGTSPTRRPGAPRGNRGSGGRCRRRRRGAPGLRSDSDVAQRCRDLGHGAETIRWARFDRMTAPLTLRVSSSSQCC
jgi:hypothetical protein